MSYQNMKISEMTEEEKKFYLENYIAELMIEHAEEYKLEHFVWKLLDQGQVRTWSDGLMLRFYAAYMAKR